MANIDDRIVSMSWESNKFQQGVSMTMESLQKLNTALKDIGVNNGLDNIEKSSNKITFSGLTTAINKVKSMFGFREATDGFSGIEKSADKVTFNGLTTALNKVKGMFGFQEADRAFANIESSSGRVSFSGLGRAIEGISSKFSVITGAASVAFGNVTFQAIQAGERMVKAFSFGPIIDGFHNYETQINAVQTILANTGLKGAKGLGQVNSVLKDLNTYANKTVYNFSEMVHNIGTFTAAGVDLKTSALAIKGIANLAAMSGSNSQQAASAMYQLSQAIAAGQVHLQDWNSVVNAGMGGTVFQRALAQTAQSMGTLKDGTVKLIGPMKNVSIAGESFRNSLQTKGGGPSWLTSKVLTTTLKEFTGDMTKAQLAAIGFNNEQIKAIQAQAKVAVGAAVNIKTLTQLMQALKEEVATAWAAVFKTIFGNLATATKLFSAVHVAVENALTIPIYKFNKVLKEWAKLGGRKDLLSGLKQGLDDIGAVLKPIHQAFLDVFPHKTAQDLLDLTKRFHDFVDTLKIGPDTATHLRDTFKGLFSVLDIGKQIVSGIFTAFGHMLGGLKNSSGGILGLSGSIGQLLTGLDAWLKKGDRLHNFFAKLGNVLAVPIHLISQLAGAINGLFTGKENGASKSFAGLAKSLDPIQRAGNLARNAWDGLMHILSGVGKAVGPVVHSIGNAFSHVADAIANALKTNDWNSVFNVIQTVLIAGLGVTIKRALSKGIGLNFDIGKGILGNLSGSLDVLRGSLLQIQKNIQANTMLQISIAVAALAAAITALSLVNPKRLASSMTAITVGLGQLLGAMALLNKVASAGKGSLLKMPLISASLILLATAMDILSVSVLALSRLSWQELAKGLAGVIGLLAAVSVAVIPLTKAGPGLVLAGVGLNAVATAMVILSGAVKIFSTMSWAEIGKGLASVAASLVAIGLGMKLMPLNLPITGAGLVLVGVGLAAIGGAVRIFGGMKWESIGKGLAAVAGSLVAIGVGMSLMPVSLPITAAGLILVGIALTELGGALAIMGHMKLETLVKGLATLAASLAILAVGVTAMSGALPGAAALLIIATALAIFAPALGLLGHMSWGTIAKGLAAIAASLVVIGAAGTIAAPAFVALGAGLALLGAGVAAVGAGVYLLAKGVSLLGTNGSKGVAVFMAALTGMIAVIPKVLVSFVQGLLQIVEQMANLAPKFAEAMAKIVTTGVAFIIQEAPKVAAAFTALVTAAIQVLDQNAGPIIKAGFGLLLQLLSGISNNISRVVSTVADIVTKFLSGLAKHAGQLTAAGATFLVKWLSGVTNNIGRVVNAGGDLVAKFISSVANQIPKVVAAGANIAIKIISGVTNNIGRIVTAGATAAIKFVSGVESNMERVINKGVELAGKFINSVVKASLKLVDVGAQAVVKFVNGIADAINKYEPQLIAAGGRVAAAITKGILGGFVSLPGQLVGKVEGIVNDAIDSVSSLVGGGHLKGHVVKSSGFRIMTDFAAGMTDGIPVLTDAAGNVLNTGLNVFAARFVQHVPKAILDIGQYLGKTFATHLLGSTSDINSAFTDLSNKLVDEYHTAGDKIKAAQDRYDKFNAVKGKKRDDDAISKAKDALNELRDIHDRTLAAHITLMNGLSNEKSELLKLSKSFDTITNKLKNAQQVLKDSKQTRDDFKKSITDSFSSASDIPQASSDTTNDPFAALIGGNSTDALSPDAVKTYTDGLSSRVEALKKFITTLGALRKLGLDDKTYQKFLSDGITDQPFMDQLLAAGPDAINSINNLDDQLTTAATGLGDDASKTLYQAGVDAAQGLVDGLKQKQGDIRKAMEDIAGSMINAIKKKLKIQSPSREFAKIGSFSSLGIAQGLTASSKVVVDAATAVGDDALAAIRDKMAAVSQAMSDEIDPNPTITPILDLTKVREGAKNIAGLTSGISTATSYGQAASISASGVNTSTQDGSDPNMPTVKFEQNNYSPEALSDTEIYRQTRNQLSQAKKALGLQN